MGWRGIGVAVAVVLMVLIVVGSARAGRARPIIGIGEQKPGMFQSTHWTRLRLHTARYIAPWDALKDPYQLALLDAWMAAADRSGTRVLLGFAHSLRNERNARTLPTVRQFERHFKRFRRRYPTSGTGWCGMRRTIPVP